MILELLEFIEDRLVFDGKKKQFKNIFCSIEEDINIEINIIDETEWLINNIEKYPEYPYDHKIYSSYDELFKEIEKKIYDFDKNNETDEYMEFKIDNMEKGIWNLIIIVHKKFKNNMITKNKEETEEETDEENIFTDMQTSDLEEFIIDLKSDYNDLKSEHDKLKSDYNDLKSESDKLKSDFNKFKSDYDKYIKSLKN